MFRLSARLVAKRAEPRVYRWATARRDFRRNSPSVWVSATFPCLTAQSFGSLAPPITASHLSSIALAAEEARQRSTASPLPTHAIDLAERMIIEEIRLDPAEFGPVVNLDAHVEIKRANRGPLVEQDVFRLGQDV
jgi:hypothetical protein